MAGRWSARRLLVVGIALALFSSLLVTLPAVASLATGSTEPPAPPQPGEAAPMPPQSYGDPAALPTGPPPPAPDAPTATLPPGKATTRVADGASAKAGALPISVRAEKDAFPDGVDATVEVLDTATQQRLGAKGALFSVTLTQPSSKSSVDSKGLVTVIVDYSSVLDDGVAAWADRLGAQLVPACALEEPIEASCPAGTALVVSNDLASHQLTITLPSNGVSAAKEAAEPAEPSALSSAEADSSSSSDSDSESESAESSTTPETESSMEAVPAGASGGGGGGGSMVMLTAGASGSSGNYGATPMSSLTSWNVSAQSGAFNTAYHVPVPPAAVGATPSVDLQYSSAALDGFTADKNTQPSWVGQGWDYSPGYVTREYRGCNLTQAQGDLCWAGHNYSIVLNGVRSRLVATDGTYRNYRLEGDPGWDVWQVFVPPVAARGDQYGEEFVVRDTDGTQYVFGAGIGADGTTSDGSLWNVPIYGPNTGDPCHEVTYGLCSLPWRWNLDKVIDVHGNTTWYRYQIDWNYYNARGLSWTNQWLYARGGYPTEIDYSYVNGQPRAKVLFHLGGRCLGTCSSAPSDWPDTPIDLNCDGVPGTNCPQQWPSFYGLYRLDAIYTQYLDAGGVWRAAENTDFSDVRFPDPGDGSSPKLWLDWVQRIGAPDQLLLPKVEFYGAAYANRWFASGPPAGATYMTMYRIARVVNELGGNTFISYGQPHPCQGTPPSGFWNNNQTDCFPQWVADPGGTPGWGVFNKWLVTQVQTTDGYSINPSRLYTYRYIDAPGWHYGNDPTLPENGGAGSTCPGSPPPPSACNRKNWNDFRGHSDVQVIRNWVAGDELRFFRGMNGDRADNSGNVRSVSISSAYGPTLVDSPELSGREHERRQHTIDANQNLTTLLRRTWTEYNSQPSATSPTGDAAFRVNRNILWTDDYGTTQKVTLTNWVYDGYGNVTTELDYGDYYNGADDRRVEHGYAVNTSAWIVNRPTHQFDRTGLAVGGTIVAHTDWYYDNQAWGAAPVRGDVTRNSLWTDFSTTANTDATYNGYGQVTQVKDPRLNPTNTVYNATTGFPSTVTNALSHQTQTVPDLAHGGPLTVTDANGNVTTANYDTLGRLRKVWYPTEPTNLTPSVEYLYDIDLDHTRPSSVATLAYQDSSTTIRTQSWVDGYGAEVQSEAPAPNGQRLLTSKHYDTGGRLIDSAGPYVISGTGFAGYSTPAWGSIPVRHYLLYDALDRVTNDQQYSNNTMLWQTTTAFNGWTTTVTPPRGGASDTVLDGWGRTAQIVERDAGPAGNATTSYQYDTDGRLVGVDDAAAPTHHTSITVDLAGRKTDMTDPDMGHWHYVYDAAGNLVTQTDAKNQTTWFGYDTLNRKTQQRQTSSSGTLLAQWSFDPTGYKGLLGASTGYDSAGNTYIHRITAYDDKNQVTADQYEISAGVGGAAGTYKQTYEYDHTGHVIKMKYPADDNGALGEEVTAVYDGFGRPSTLAGSATYVNSTTYNGLNQMTGQVLGSNTISRVLGYDSATTRMTALQAGSGGSTTNRQNFAYAYDNASNITSIVDANDSNQKQCFTYDDRQRLTLAQTGNDACSSYNDTRGTNEYKQTWTYDKLSNVTQDTSKLGSGSTTTRNHTFDPNHPHAPNTVGPNTYGYDANGNQTTRTVGGQAATLAWDYSNHLTTFTQGATTETNAYDADGNRIRRTTGTTTVLYLGGNVEATSVGAAAPTIVRYYTLGGQRIAMRNAAGSLYFILPDHLGGANVTYRSEGGDTDTQRYYPYGSIRPGPNNTLATDRNFTGQTLDPTTTLTHMGARDYDASTQTFTSADSVTPGAGSKSLNRFAYAYGNPMLLVDPTGHVPGCREGSGNCGIDRYGTGLNGAPRSGSSGGTPHVDPNFAVRLYTNDKSNSGDPVVGAFNNYSGKCFDEFASCAAASTLAMGGSLADAHAVWRHYCTGATSPGSGCSDGGTWPDAIANFILIDLPAMLLTGGVVRYIGGKLFVSAAEETGSLTLVGEGFSTSERTMAQLLADQGRNVVLREATGVGQMSDLLVDGVAYDVFTPTTGSVDRIVSAIASKGSQVRGGGVVVDLSQSPLTPADLGNLLPRVQGVTPNVSDIIVIG